MKKVFVRISLILFHLTSCVQTSTEDHVTEWINANIIPIKTVEAGHGFEDLLPLGEVIGEARIVSLGEPTHGNREVFQLKHRLVEYLVTEKGFNIFALECPFGEAFDVNKYILEGNGTHEEALAGINFWAWDTHEFVELLKWMRSYNADPTNINKIKFYGFDMQAPERAARIMLEYLRKVDPQLREKVIPELGIYQIPFSEPKLMGVRPYIPEEYDKNRLFEIRRVIKAFDDNKDDYISTTGWEQYNLARQHARQVEMWIEGNIDDGQNWTIVRESGQAENIHWILDREGRNSKVVIWAHNVHVAKGENVHMGKYLNQIFGDQLKIIGMFFNQGGFKALDVDVPSKGIHSFSVGPAPDSTLEHAMAFAGLSLAALNMGQLPNEGPVHDWFYDKHPTRHSGAGYNMKRPEDYYWSYTPAEDFDILFFLDSTSPVNYINNSDFDEIWLLDKKLEKPVNLDFESNKSGEIPESWLVWSKFQRLGVSFEVTDQNPCKGKNSAMLHRPGIVTFGEFTPNLTQTIDAKPYRGKKIRFSAATRSDVSEPGFAFLRLVIEPNVLQSAHVGLPPLFDTLDKFRIKSSQWEIQNIETEIPEIANTINYGIFLRDFGTVWLDAVQIEVIGN